MPSTRSMAEAMTSLTCVTLTKASGTKVWVVEHRLSEDWRAACRTRHNRLKLDATCVIAVPLGIMRIASCFAVTVDVVQRRPVHMRDLRQWCIAHELHPRALLAP